MNRPEKRTPDPPHPPARRTPYELVFDVEEFEARVFPGIRAEAEERGVDALHPERFAFLSLVGDAVRRVVPASAPPDALQQYRELFYHAFNFWRYGKRLYVFDPAVARFLVEAAPRLDTAELETPHPSQYLQLPRNLFWASISPELTPEPADGFFVTTAAGEDALGRPYTRLTALLVLGIRRNRAGFSVVPFDTAVGPGITAAWADEAARAEGADFSSVLPGGELAGIYSIVTTDEALKLLARALWYVASFPGDLLPETVPERRTSDRPAAPPLSRLPYVRVVLGEHAAGDPQA